MKTINHHPELRWLEAYAEGTLLGVKALLVAAHLEYCPRCREIVRQHEETLAEQCWRSTPCSDDPLLHTLLSNVLERLPEPDPAERFQAQHLKAQSALAAEPTAELNTELTLYNQSFTLPRVLAKRIHNDAKNLGSWSRLPGGVHQAKLHSAKGDHRCFFIHMAASSKVATHTHRGEEITLVLHGSFSDEKGEYQAGDFMQLNGTHRHGPFTKATQDCLVISALDKPLHFTSGLSRLLNPLSSLFFR